MGSILAAWCALVPPAGRQEDPCRAWVEQLGSDDPSARDDAALRLRRTGRPAWPHLERATRSTDLEVAGRASDMLESIRTRRRIPFRLLEAFPSAEAALRGGPPAQRSALARAMGSYVEESVDFLAELLLDADPETALAAAESLNDARPASWTPRLLDLLMAPAPPRPRRITELLASPRGALDDADLRRRFETAEPPVRARLLELSAAAHVSFPVDARDVLALLAEPRTRAGTIEWMVAFNRREFAVPLEERLAPDAPDAAELLYGLRRLNHAVAVERLVPFARHEQDAVREHVVQMLPDEPCAAVDALLRGFIEDPSSAVRARALALLGRREADASRETLLAVFLSQDGDPRDTAAFLLSRSRDWAEPRARRLLLDPLPERRARAAELLVRMTGLEAVRQLASDPQESVRRWLLNRALSTSEDSSRAIVRQLASDPAPAIRFDALRALARTGRHEDVEALVPYLESPEFSFRYAATELYLRQGGEKARDLMKKLLDDRDATLQCLAISALQERASPEAAPQAVRFLTDPDASLRRTAGSYLEQAVRSTRDPAVVTQVTDLLDRLDGETLTTAASIVTAYGSPAQEPAVRRLLATGRAPSEQRALNAICRWSGPNALLECLTEGRAASVLECMVDHIRTRSLDPATAAALEKRLQQLARSPSVAARRTVIRFAPDLCGRDGAALVSGLLSDPDAATRYEAIRAARRLDLPVAARLREMLDDEDPDVRLAAALALHEADAQARPTIDEMLAREECPWVKSRVAASLRR